MATQPKTTEINATDDPEEDENENQNENETENETKNEERVEEYDEEDDEEIRSAFPSWSDLELKYKMIICAGCLTLLYIGVYISTILSVILGSIGVLGGGFKWFSSTNLSVEITVFLAKFFPPTANPVIDCSKTKGCEWSKAFRDNWQVIYNEYLEFEKKYNYRPQMDDVYPNGSITNWDRKWPTVNLRCYGLDTEISKYFPKTMKLVNESDTWLSHVMFSILMPNKFIPRHRGPYRGVFRYHLHLEIPEYKKAEDELYLAVWPDTSSADFWSPENVPDGEPIIVKWNDGDDFLFDDTCVHEVINFTGKRRIILFCDVERYDVSFFAKIIHRIFMNLAKYLPAIQNCKAVQDKYLKSCIDPKTKEPVRFGGDGAKTGGTSQDQIDMSPSNSWMWYNTAPEILPYKKARVVIKQQKARQKKTT